MADFRNLAVWQHSHRFSLDCYKATSTWPSQEQFGLTSQVRRAAVSVGANIAEGSGRGTDRDFARFLRIALGSANELESLLLVAEALGYLSPDSHVNLHRSNREIRKMLTGLIKTLGG